MLGALLISVAAGLIFGHWTQVPVEVYFTKHLPYVLRALISGVLFNIANFLLIAAVFHLGISFAFLTCYGFTLMIDMIIYLIVNRFEQPLIVFIGVFLVFFSIVMINLVFKKIPSKEPFINKARTLAIIAGILTGLFYPLLRSALGRTEASPLNPFTTDLFFCIGLLLCNVVANPILMRKPLFGPPIAWQTYFKTKLPIHLIAMLGGGMWSLGLILRLIAFSYEKETTGLIFLFVNIATVINFLWGILYWKEVPKDLGLGKRVALGFGAYLLGILLISFYHLE